MMYLLLFAGLAGLALKPAKLLMQAGEFMAERAECDRRISRTASRASRLRERIDAGNRRLLALQSACSASAWLSGGTSVPALQSAARLTAGAQNLALGTLQLIQSELRIRGRLTAPDWERDPPGPCAIPGQLRAWPTQDATFSFEESLCGFRLEKPARTVAWTWVFAQREGPFAL